MTTIHDAHLRLAEQLEARRAAGLPADVEQIDIVLAEDHATIFAYAYLAGTDDEIVVSFDPAAGESFDRDALRDQLISPPRRVLH
jgi:hypothetical protein